QTAPRSSSRAAAAARTCRELPTSLVASVVGRRVARSGGAACNRAVCRVVGAAGTGDLVCLRARRTARLSAQLPVRVCLPGVVLVARATRVVAGVLGHRVCRRPLLLARVGGCPWSAEAPARGRVCDRGCR